MGTSRTTDRAPVRLALPGLTRALYRQARDKAGDDRALQDLVVGYLTQYATGHAAEPLTGEDIQRIRRQLEESRETFGARWMKSGRTVEGWEQDRNAPDPVILREIARL